MSEEMCVIVDIPGGCSLCGGKGKVKLALFLCGKCEGTGVGRRAMPISEFVRVALEYLKDPAGESDDG